MDGRRVALAVAAGIILLLTLATGPFGPLALSTAGETATPGTGSAEVSVVSAPETVTLTSAQHGASGFYLQVPAAVVEVTDLQGNPILEYSLTVDELGYARTTVHFLADSGEGRQTVVLERDHLDRDPDRETYEGQIELIVRGENKTVLLDREVEVRIDR